MQPADARWLEWSLPALAWVGGSLDAVSYLALGHVFTANMTGNTVLLAMALGVGSVCVRCARCWQWWGLYSGWPTAHGCCADRVKVGARGRVVCRCRRRRCWVRPYSRSHGLAMPRSQNRAPTG